jgi:hypothetical protein
MTHTVRELAASSELPSSIGVVSVPPAAEFIDARPRGDTPTDVVAVEIDLVVPTMLTTGSAPAALA